MPGTERGKVTRFNTEKGFGFIQKISNDGISHEDVFVHYSAIDAGGHKTLN